MGKERKSKRTGEEGRRRRNEHVNNCIEDGSRSELRRRRSPERGHETVQSPEEGSSGSDRKTIFSMQKKKDRMTNKNNMNCVCMRCETDKYLRNKFKKQKRRDADKKRRGKVRELIKKAAEDGIDNTTVRVPRSTRPLGLDVLGQSSAVSSSSTSYFHLSPFKWQM